RHPHEAPGGQAGGGDGGGLQAGAGDDGADVGGGQPGPGGAVEAHPVLAGGGGGPGRGDPPIHLGDAHVVGDVDLAEVDGAVRQQRPGGRERRIVSPRGEPVVDGQLLPERAGGRVDAAGRGDGDEVRAAVAEGGEASGGAAVGGGDEDALACGARRGAAAEVDGEGGGAGVVAGEGAAVGVGDLHGAAGQCLVPRDVHRGRLAVVADEVEGGGHILAGGGRLVDRDRVLRRRRGLEERAALGQVRGDPAGERAPRFVQLRAELVLQILQCGVQRHVPAPPAERDRCEHHQAPPP